MRILFFGDSITQGFWGVEGGWVERIRKHYDALWVENLQSGVQPEIFNLGISGDTTRSLLARIEPETKARRWPSDSLVVVIAIGTNDDLFESDTQWVSPAEFRANLETILSIVSPLADAIALVGNPACDEARTSPVAWGDFTYSNKELERSEGIIREVADKNGLVFVPLFKDFKKRLDEGDDLLTDGLHPNDVGHQFIADKVRPALQTSIDRVKNL